MQEKMRGLLLVLSCVFMLSFYNHPAYAAELPTEETEQLEETEEPEDTEELEETEEPEIYRATIVFNSNGGKGTMENLVVESGKKTVLPKNKFKRTGFLFNGWSREKDGSGTKYADGRDVSNWANKNYDGKRITLYAQWKVEYRTTVVFKGNGGTGTMKNLVVESGKKTVLPKNKFKKTGFLFNGWSRKKDGSGTKYADGRDVSKWANKNYNGKKITLYARWKMKTPAPVIKKAQSQNPSAITLTFKKASNVDSYEVWYSTSRNFPKKNREELKVDKSKTSVDLCRVIPGKKYYIKIRGYYNQGTKKKPDLIPGDWSKTKWAKVKNGKTIYNVKSETAVEADVKLSGSGTGYHLKLVLGNPSSAVSFGLQYDTGAEDPYGGKTMALIENISSNAAGEQRYERVKELGLNKKYHLMMTIDAHGKGNVYVDYKKVGSFNQPALSQLHFVRIESCARLNGDSVNAEFSNIRYRISSKNSDTRILGEDLTWEEKRLNKGLSYQYDKKKQVIRMSGTVYDVNGDWDSDYEGVSEILQFGY